MSAPFNIVSLGSWLQVCRAAGVAAVPAEEVARFPVQAWVECNDEKHEATLTALYKTLKATHKTEHMLRWDHVAPHELKSAAVRPGGNFWEWRFCEPPSLDDPRAYDCLDDYLDEEMVVWQRPWVWAQAVAGYPVEYRAFVENGVVRGVSNYYPQRPLPDSKATRADIAVLKRQTTRLIPHVPLPLGRVDVFGLDPMHRHFTADFIKDEKGKLLFLEGGPPHTPEWGAHPCCFPGGKVNGVALAPA